MRETALFRKFLQSLFLTVVTSCSLAAAVTVEGSAYLREGAARRPFPGVYVTVRGSGGAPATSRTDAEGRYRFVDLPPGRVIIEAVRPGYLVHSAGGQMDEKRIRLECPKECSDARLDFEFIRGAAVTGIVLDPLGEPVEGAKVTLDLADGLEKAEGDDKKTAGTDDRGVFRLAGLRGGSYVLRVEAGAATSTLGPTSTPVDIGPGQQIGGVRLVLRRSAVFNVSGTVRGIGSRSQAAIRVMLMDPSDQEHSYWTQTDDSGRFRLREVREGRYTAWASGSGKVFLGVLDVRNELSDLFLSPAPLAALTGAVKIAGDPAPELVSLALASKDGLGAHRLRLHGPDFRFRLSEVIPGAYSLQLDQKDGLVVGKVTIGDTSLGADTFTISGGANEIEVELEVVR